MTGPTVDRPLAGLLIVDAVKGPLAAVTRYLAELGAQVVRTVQPEGDPIEWAALNNGKADLGQDNLDALLASAHAIVFDRNFPFDPAALRQERPGLVTLAVSDFGKDTRFTDWQASDPVLHALSGILSRSGIRGRAPLLPPGRLAYECAATQAAFILVTALYHALNTGQGQHIDFSALDGAAQALDPGFGISGSATLGKPAHLLSRNRPVAGFQYPIFACADGFVRICLLARRQWLGMFRWMGEPPQFASADYEKTSVRYKSPDLLPALAAFFSGRTRAELEKEGQRFGVPISGLSTFAEALESDHFNHRHALKDITLKSGERAVLPNGSILIDGKRMEPRLTDAATADWPKPSAADGPAFEGLRVLDLGVIVVGAEQGRLFGDGGADVIKIESRDYPDGNRQSYLSYGLSVSFAAGHRNKRSLGLNLRHPEGRSLFLELVRSADIILSNFKPGTMDSLGLGVDVLAKVNPSAIFSDSSAFGATGPWRERMGYGPLVRAATGLTLAWRYPDDPQGFCDTVTIYPDHVAARVSAIAVVALLIRRLRSGAGGSASVAQSEVMLAHFSSEMARVSLGLDPAEPKDWPWAVYPAQGEDEWCVITVRDDQDWSALAGITSIAEPEWADRTARIANRSQIDLRLTEWLSGKSAQEAMELLQSVGVPAAKMLRVAELPDFDYFRERKFFRVEHHPYLAEDVVAESGATPGGDRAPIPSRPAPLMGEHTAEIIRQWFGDKVNIDALIAANVLEPTETSVWDDVRTALGAPRPAESAKA